MDRRRRLPAETRPTSRWARVRQWFSTTFRRQERVVPVVPRPIHPEVDHEMRAFDPVAVAAVRRVGRGMLAAGRAATRFYSCNPPVYDGRHHPTRVRNWLHHLEYTFMACDIAQEEWVVLAVSMLEDNAEIFWSALTEQERMGMTWGGFRQLMLHQFLPQALPDIADLPDHPIEVSFTLAREFVHRADRLRMADQETMSSYLARVLTEVFAHNTIFRLTDDEKCDIVWRGLSPGYQSSVIPRPRQSVLDYMAEIRLYEERLNDAVRAYPRRAYPQPMRHDDEAGPSHAPQEAETSRRRPRPSTEIEEEQSSSQRQRVHEVLVTDDSEEDPEEDAEEDPDEDPAEDPAEDE